MSSVFAAALAKGEDLTSAARSAKTFIEKAIIFGADCVTGAGHSPVNHGFEPIKMIINENR